MISLSIKNFRKIKGYQRLFFEGINFLVGENNSGKSTTTKGFLLATENARRIFSPQYKDKVPVFDFSLGRADIDSFERAFCNKAEDNEMNFQFQHENGIYYEIKLSYDEALANEQSCKIDYVMFDMTDDFVTIDYKNDCILLQGVIEGDTIVKEIVFKNPDSVSTQSVINNWDFLKKITNPSTSLFANIDQYIVKADPDLLSLLKEGRYANLNTVDIEVGNPVVFLPAYGVPSGVFYSSFNPNAMSFVRYAEGYGDEMVHEFVNEYLKFFEIGVDHQVINCGKVGRHNFDKYSIKIQEPDGKWLHLADKGMGSSQVFKLIVDIAQVIFYKSNFHGIVIVEEPEQNLHPSLQSKLTDFFYAIHQKYGVQFMIETHSEYIIRRSQVLLAQFCRAVDPDTEYEFPFQCFYFPADSEPYSMSYRTDGAFEKDFGPGFFDVANESILQLL